MARKPLNHPAIWRGQELFTRDDWRWTLDREQIDTLQRLAVRFASGEAPGEGPSLSADGLAALQPLLRRIQHALENGSGAVLIPRLPIETWTESQCAGVFQCLMKVIGTPVPQTADGRRLFRVQDEGFDEQDPRARGPSSRKRLSFHTDRCDVIAFLCIRAAAQGGANQLVSSMALYNQLLKERPDLLEQLCRPYMYQRHNVDPGNQHPYYAQPVFSFCNGHFAASLLRVLIERAYADPRIGPMSAPQREALDYLEAVAERPELQAVFRQEPGDIVLLNNYVTLHRRDAFLDDPEPAHKRLLLRLWLAVPNSRPLDPSYEAAYGATAAGAVRGGMRAAP